MMCDFFSIVTNPNTRPGERFYFNWEQRLERNHKDCDSHSTICKFYELDEDDCNKYEYNPLTKELTVDQINCEVDDRAQVHDWLDNLDWRKIVKPLIVKPIVNPFEIEACDVTDDVISKLRVWASVGASVWASVGDSVRDSVGASVWASVRDSVGASVWASVGDSVRASVRASVGDSVGASVRASVRAYISSFLSIEYKYDFSSCVWLWEHGFVPSFDGKTWRLHSGENASIVYELKG